MNIGDTVKLIKKEYPSITISRIRFLEKEGLIKPKSKNNKSSFAEFITKKHIEKNIRTVPNFPILETLMVLVLVKT